MQVHTHLLPYKRTNKGFLISKVCCFNSEIYEIKWLDVASAYKTREMTPHHSGYANAYGGSKSVWLAAKPIFNVRVFMKTLHRASFSTGAWSTPACSASGRQPQSLVCLILTAMWHIVVTLHKMFKKSFVILNRIFIMCLSKDGTTMLIHYHIKIHPSN
jgi:hypothetical protein